MEIKNENKKPQKAKPQFYACCFQPLQAIAREMGYNLLMHGSMDRDMDLVAVPWVDEPAEELKLITAFDDYLRGDHHEPETAERHYRHNFLPGGRSSWTIDLNRGGYWNGGFIQDGQWYIDISITPLIKKFHEKL